MAVESKFEQRMSSGARRLRQRGRLPELRFVAYVLPAFAVVLVFRYWPIIVGGQVSLWNYSLLGGFRGFVGFDNYARALSDPAIRHSVLVTGWYALLKIPAQVVLALCLAMFLRQNTKMKQGLRTLIFLPVVTSTIVAAVIWGMMFHSQVGLINGMLRAVGISSQPFLVSPTQAMPSIALMAIWKDTGLTMIILMSALLSIPTTYYEAARTDGAGRWALFRYLTLPLLKPALVFVFVMELIEAFQVFVPMLSMTNGGPANATSTVVFSIYRLGFRLNEMGYATAVSLLLAAFVVVLLLVFAGLRRIAR